MVQLAAIRRIEKNQELSFFIVRKEGKELVSKYLTPQRLINEWQNSEKRTSIVTRHIRAMEGRWGVEIELSYRTPNPKEKHRTGLLNSILDECQAQSLITSRQRIIEKEYRKELNGYIKPTHQFENLNTNKLQTTQKAGKPQIIMNKKAFSVYNKSNVNLERLAKAREYAVIANSWPQEKIVRLSNLVKKHNDWKVIAEIMNQEYGKSMLPRNYKQRYLKTLTPKESKELERQSRLSLKQKQREKSYLAELIYLNLDWDTITQKMNEKFKKTLSRNTYEHRCHFNPEMLQNRRSRRDKMKNHLKRLGDSSQDWSFIKLTLNNLYGENVSKENYMRRYRKLIKK